MFRYFVFQSERLIKNDGDFLVRESSQSVGQYVLTGMQTGAVKHLLLVDSDGLVRTTITKFLSLLVPSEWDYSILIQTLGRTLQERR